MEKVQWTSYTFSNRFCSMLSVDFRRMFTTKLFYILLGISVAIPILILVMTTMMAGTVSVDPNTGVEMVMEAYNSAWQVIGTESTASASGSMDMMSMVNINLLYMLIAVLSSIFVVSDFRSGYAKNLFTTRAKKSDYILSKSVTITVAGALMLAGFFIGTVLGGAIAGLPFDAGSAGTMGVLFCMIAKIFLVAVFVPVFVMMGVIAKQKLWLAVLLSLAINMFTMNMIPMATPLDSTILNTMGCLIGGVLFTAVFGFIGKIILQRADLL